MKHLSGREQEILLLTAHGLVAKEVAVHLGTSIQTVKRQLESARIKLDAKTTTHAVYLKYGQVDEVTTA